MTSPVTSTSVATKGADALAGSRLKRRSTKGSIEPASDPEGSVRARVSKAKSKLQQDRELVHTGEDR